MSLAQVERLVRADGLPLDHAANHAPMVGAARVLRELPTAVPLRRQERPADAVRGLALCAHRIVLRAVGTCEKCAEFRCSEVDRFYAALVQVKRRADGICHGDSVRADLR